MSKADIMIAVSGAREALLPWECAADYNALRGALARDLAPQGAAEHVLVARLVWIEWRRRRLALAERAVHMAALADRVGAPTRTLERAGVRNSATRERLDLKEIVDSDPAADAAEGQRHAADRKATARALAILERDGADAYARAVAALHADTRAWWEDGLAGEYGDDRSWEANADCLGAFLRDAVAPADETIASAAAARPAVRLQVFGESFDPDRLERLMAIEGRLDRQFEKALAILIQLQQMRGCNPRRAIAAGACTRAG